MFCGAYDVTAAGYLAWLLVRARAVGQTGSTESLKT